MKAAFITGIAGFVGQHLARVLIDAGYAVSGIYHLESDILGMDLELKSQVSLYQCDITDKTRVSDLVSNLKVDVIYHLAAVSHVPFAEKNPALAFDVNTMGTWNLLDAAKNIPGVTFVFVSSCEVYGRQPSGRRLYNETDPMMPSNVYGLTKASAELLCTTHAKRDNMLTIIFRPFNHIGVGQAHNFVASDFARQIVSIERGDRSPEIAVGNLDVLRDFSDVRDVVRGYVLAADKVADSQLFNICSGKPITIRALLDTLLSISSVDISVKVDPEKFRKNDNDYFGGSFEKFRNQTAWEPRISLEKTLMEILDYWRNQVSVQH